MFFKSKAFLSTEFDMIQVGLIKDGLKQRSFFLSLCREFCIIK